MKEKEQFIEKWSSWWALQKDEPELTAAFREELNRLLRERIGAILLSHKLDGKYTEKEALVEIAKIIAE
jgi:hypothetical protein